MIFFGIYFLFRSFIETELMHESGLFNRFSKLSLVAISTEESPLQLVIILILKINQFGFFNLSRKEGIDLLGSIFFLCIDHKIICGFVHKVLCLGHPRNEAVCITNMDILTLTSIRRTQKVFFSILFCSFISVSLLFIYLFIIMFLYLPLIYHPKTSQLSQARLAPRYAHNLNTWIAAPWQFHEADVVLGQGRNTLTAPF